MAANSAIQQDTEIENIVATHVSEADYFANHIGHYEWVKGNLIEMSPITREHAKLHRYLSNLLQAYFIEKPIGDFEMDPFVMRLEDISNRQPDLQVILGDNMANLGETYMDGPADIVIEITSEATVAVDRGIKFEEYRQGRVPEYWIIDPRNKEALFYRLESTYYVQQPIVADVYQTTQLPGLHLHVPTLWLKNPPNMQDVLQSIKKMLAD